MGARAGSNAASAECQAGSVRVHSEHPSEVHRETSIVESIAAVMGVIGAKVGMRVSAHR